MIKINLVAEAPAAAATKKRRLPEFSLGAKQGDVILLTVLAVALLVVGTRWFLLDRTIDNLKTVERQKTKERDELKPYIDKVEELEAKREILKHKISVINELKNNQRGPVRIMDEVSRALPELVWLTSMELKANILTIEGVAMDETAVANFIANLKSSPFFEEPSLKSMRLQSSTDTHSFNLNCVFTYAPPELAGSETTPSPPADATGDV